MMKMLENFVRIEYNYAKKSDQFDTVNAYFHNAFGATCFALDMAETQEQYTEMMRFWDDWKEKFVELMMNCSR